MTHPREPISVRLAEPSHLLLLLPQGRFASERPLTPSLACSQQLGPEGAGAGV